MDDVFLDKDFSQGYYTRKSLCRCPGYYEYPSEKTVYLSVRQQEGRLHGERYEVVMGSDLARDGMFLELWDRPCNELALEVFFSDAKGSFATTRYRTDVPLEVEAWFHAEARRRLSPAPDAEPGATAEGGDL